MFLLQFLEIHLDLHNLLPTFINPQNRNDTLLLSDRSLLNLNENFQMEHFHTRKCYATKDLALTKCVGFKEI